MRSHLTGLRGQPWIASGNIRAYCGAPLTMNSGRNKVTIGKSTHRVVDERSSDRVSLSRNIGSLCVADDKPRPDFNEDIELALVSSL